MTAPSIRARVREELTSEIKAVARRQLTTEGANLSLRAVARELGMVSSAVYRYFPSRDDLLTALIIDCYNELGEAGEKAVEGAEGLLSRWLAFGHGIRDWALAHPAEYALIYGSPVPGYKAPQDTVGPASRTTTVIVKLLVEGYLAGELKGTDERPPLPPPLETEMRRAINEIFPEMPVGLLARGMTAWVQLFGVITFELFGRFNNFIEESRRDFFDHQMRVMARHVGM
ncbi:MAG TPA: TetR family transcriptional regulator [Micromonosporaceae bacterium]|nr:TetR family transcriptional regulator [Micromonosporaceae bacterium]